MTTSGTISNTTIDVATIIEHATRRAGVSPADITTDSLNSATQSLFFYLSALANDGVSLWTIEKKIIGMLANNYQYSVGPGTVDLKNVLRRTSTFVSNGVAASSAGGIADNAFSQDFTLACTQNSASGNISYTFTQNNTIDMVGIMPNGDQTYSLVFEYFTGAIWVNMLTVPQQTYSDQTWYMFDLPKARAAIAFRVRETGLGILNLVEVVFNKTTLEIPVPRISFDQYTNLTDKVLGSQIPNQYWLDRHLDNPVINLWPMPNNSLDQLVVWRTRYIQDVGALSNTLEIPQRWIDAIVMGLSARLMLELPNVDVSRYNVLKAEADAATYRAQQEERDKSPIYISPNISCYTR